MNKTRRRLGTEPQTIMTTYAERASTIPGGVLWCARTTDTAGTKRVLPDGCMDLIWMDGDVVVAGPDTRAYVHIGTTGEDYVGLRFAPGALPELLRVSAADLVNRRVALRSVVGDRTARWLVDRLAETESPGRALEAFPDAYAAGRSRTPAPLTSGTRGSRPWAAGQAEPVISEITRLLAAGTPVAAVADRVKCSTRQLHRLSRERFGYGPKTLASILRFQRALGLAEVEHSTAMIARRAGYADQAHLSRETRRLAGTTFGWQVRS